VTNRSLAARRAARRAFSYFELLVVLALLVVLIAAVAVPSYRSFSAGRAARAAAATLAEDLALLQRSAQNGNSEEGAALVVTSLNPFAYAGYRGRPAAVDPRSTLGSVIVERTFPGVQLTGGPINVTTPLLFASNGSAQYLTAGNIASQHQAIALQLAPAADAANVSTVQIDLFTGSVRSP